MRICDVHCHAGYTNRVTGALDADNLLDIEKRCGFDGVCVQTIVLWNPDNILRNLLAVMLKAENPDYIRIFGGVVFPQPGHTRPDLVTQAERLVDAGFDGIKLFGKPTARREYDLPFDHPAYREVYAFCEERDVPLLFHVGDPATFWDPALCTDSARARGWYYGDGGYPSLEQLYGEVERFLCDHRGLRILFPHMLFMSDNLPRLDGMLARYPRMYTDITPGTEMYHNMNRNREQARDLFVRRAGRILFGTDNGGFAAGASQNIANCITKVGNQKRFMATTEPFTWQNTCVAGLELPAGALEALFCGGFDSFLGARRVLDAGKAMRLCYWWRDRAGEGGAKNLDDFGYVIPRIEKALAGLLG